MISFFICLAILIVSYFIYGRFVSRTFEPDDRETPAVAMEDGVDYVVMPTWRIFLIQLLNIAGLGPIWGAVGGAMWGPSVFLWITFGTIFAGGVHDFASGFMSMRHQGLSVPELTGMYMGGTIKRIMRVFSTVLLFMVGVVFAVGPAGLLAYLFNQGGSAGILTNKYFWLILAFTYFFIATFLSVDKIIGKLYPLFGICLIVMAIGVGIGTIGRGYVIPEIFPLRNMHPDGTSIFPAMFISVACGAISGFHSTQSPIMARCCKSEKMSHMVFYGAMVCEGIIALVWAAASCALFPVEGGLMTGLKEAMAAGQSSCVYNICATTMGGIGAILAMLGVIACPISSGDTAFRSARLTIADALKLDQKSYRNRLLVTIPLLILGVLVSQLDYTSIWNYFASTNQILATIVLWTAAMYLVHERKNAYICALPAAFMTAVTLSFVFSSKLYLGRIPFFPPISKYLGVGIAVVMLVMFIIKARNSAKTIQ
ncbi:MAG: carbon starvation protein A [Bariatricus sp.]